MAPPTGKDNKKVDPKAAAAAKGKPPVKGAVVVDDPNSPKDIMVEYPEVPSLPDYIVIDRTYHDMKANANPVMKTVKHDPNVDKKALRLS